MVGGGSVVGWGLGQSYVMVVVRLHGFSYSIVYLNQFMDISCYLGIIWGLNSTSGLENWFQNTHTQHKYVYINICIFTCRFVYTLL